MTPISESLLFGLDVGISSCGWAVLKHSDITGHIEALGSWCFNAPETKTERTPTNQIRRSSRLLRRVVRRRRNRMTEIRRLFARHGLIDNDRPDALRQPAIDPWEMRGQGLDRQLTPEEFAVALAHIAKHRGFKSSAKRVGSNASPDDSKMLAALEKTKELSAQYRTIGEMFARDSAYVQRRRNRDGLFDRTISRDDLIDEAKILFDRQRKLGNPVASTEIEEAFTRIAFWQNPMQDSGVLVASCPFEPKEKRSSRFSPSFERFRLLCRLINLRVTDGPEERPLTEEELRLAYEHAGKTRKLTAAAIRKLIGLRDDQHFTTIPPEQEKQDITSRTGETFAGTATFRSVLGESLWRQLLPHPEWLDNAAWIISFHELTETIIKKLGEIGLPVEAYELICDALKSDKSPFAKFKGASSLSDKAVRALIPYLQQGLTYDKACQKAGYDHAASRFSGRATIDTKAKFNALMAEVRDSIANPIARKALSEGMKQLWAMRNRWGLPGAICIELARDVGNSLEKRKEIERNLKTTAKQRAREREEACELLNLKEVSSDILLRYRLWKEQGGRCCYSGKSITPDMLMAQDNRIQIDHILPWSRFGDDSYSNKGLCLAKENQAKKNQTPYEWIHGQGTTAQKEQWDKFVADVESRKNTKGLKKRNFLLKGSKEIEERFRSRNLNDTRYAARLMVEAARLLYPAGQRGEKGGTRRVFTRPGALTAALRHAWGVESLKKIGGERLHDNRHHALDAAIVAAVSEAEIQKLTKSFQECEQKGLSRPMRDVAPPWDGFRDQLKEKYETIFVARPERQRARGQGHEATIRQVREEETGPVIYERKAVSALTLADLAKIKDPDRNAGLIASLRQWIEAGKPADKPPRTPCHQSAAGHEIRKVRLATIITPAVPVRGGMAKRGDMTRVDIFKVIGKKGKPEWYMIPIYPHQIMNRSQWPAPPNKAVVEKKSEEDWPIMGAEAQFQFSLYRYSYVQLSNEKSVIKGYFYSCNRSKAYITLVDSTESTDSTDAAPSQKDKCIKTLEHIQKFSVNRFGELSPVKQETRTWHGVACTSPDQHD
ncbi:type II CRISPR RNA-guided endonuclease Cas9 [Parasaccharibacter apium]|uniref:CRISPR-associated endonuclease Cas9 n=1 Tax=Parasaccharibacter apium TaxID=1510841 RepID=A0ABX4ZKE8_9PROT|nr:type II CRISPR RNA-guided endonuclease Cas9 [Parasaccharibacter apium]POS61306.1 type II CRISPR RNA-guided endonuclease Cas9 [Parasaccharibacter apium]POS61789.1 type II CRISPR RNA-guided endonuclease Cas9 [Parasaccharibacter apium]POS65275.1 type II CRISPR RNA-guided endonuclease Cas9 [Parasaccharibacter apium]